MEYRTTKDGKCQVKVDGRWITLSREEFNELKMYDDVIGRVFGEDMEDLLKENSKNQSKKLYDAFNPDDKDADDDLSKIIEDMFNGGYNKKAPKDNYFGLVPNHVIIVVRKIPLEEEPKKEKKLNTRDGSIIEVIEQGNEYHIFIDSKKAITKENTKKIDYIPETNTLTVEYKDTKGVNEVYMLRLDEIKSKARLKEGCANNGMLELTLEKEE